MAITSKELGALSDLMESEKILISKFNFYASQTSDTVLQEKYQQIARTHEGHLDALYKQLK
jgi:hypothetical protein